MWERAVKTVIRATPFSKELRLWDLTAFVRLSDTVDVSQWMRRGCETLGDLYPNEDFILFEKAQTSFSLG